MEETISDEVLGQHHPMDGLQIAEIDACGDELVGIVEDVAVVDDDGGGSGPEAVVEMGSLEAGYGAGLAVPVLNMNDLYLSFQGEVYVFHSVSPEKVQAVLLLLGGRQLPPGNASTLDSSGETHGGVDGVPQSTAAYRLASLLRFRQKRKDRCFEKKVRYGVRQEVAQRMQRVKGQFASARPNAAEEMVSPALGSDSNSAATGLSSEEALCQHCNTTEKSTPMMRRGPGGPRTLCNACGLKWASKGKLNNVNIIPSQSPLPNSEPSVLVATAEV